MAESERFSLDAKYVPYPQRKAEVVAERMTSQLRALMQHMMWGALTHEQFLKAIKAQVEESYAMGWFDRIDATVRDIDVAAQAEAYCTCASNGDRPSEHVPPCPRRAYLLREAEKENP